MKIIKPKGKYKDYKIRKFANGECELYFKNEYLTKYENEAICMRRMRLDIPTCEVPLIHDEDTIAYLKSKIEECEKRIKDIQEWKPTYGESSFHQQIDKLHYTEIEQERINFINQLLHKHVWINAKYKDKIYGKGKSPKIQTIKFNL